ncbi:hypothetical protein ESCNG_30109 [Neisseria gonorrhoeae]|nr:hypothetical protein ESCNG_10110 [Neisseria gonorrhoeae]SCW14297.1 hypothetical protein ESCNG_30109 [Neisseria gonorrhoeae]SCW15999.1 hypothetical protein ESCNG_40063 [Neisseria gonorrhoeae]SCW20526.1 hypothetical protein ESCNG_90008 [Neisseria gonorrhoeae]
MKYRFSEPFCKYQNVLENLQSRFKWGLPWLMIT